MARTKSVASQGALAAQREANKAETSRRPTGADAFTADLFAPPDDLGGKGVFASLPGTDDHEETKVYELERVPSLAREMWLAQKIGLAMAPQTNFSFVFDGVSTPQMRRDRVRYALIAHELVDQTCGHRKGAARTFGEIFKQVYGEGL